MADDLSVLAVVDNLKKPCHRKIQEADCITRTFIARIWRGWEPPMSDIISLGLWIKRRRKALDLTQENWRGGSAAR